MKLSIIIVNYNVREQVLECLSSIYKANLPFKFEIFIVDNNSTDGSVDGIKGSFPGVNIIENRENFGFPKANNQALKKSSGEYILLLNPDTVILSGLEKMIDFMDKNLVCGIAGAKLVSGKGEVQQSCFSMLSLWSIISRNTYFSSDKKWGYDSIGRVEAISGACMLLRKGMLDKVGYMDEDLFCAEDIDLCVRCNRSGYETIFYPDATVLHIGQKSLKKNIYVKLTNEYISKIYFFKKYYPYWKVICLKIYFFTEILLKIILRTLGGIIRKPPDSWVRIKAYFKVMGFLFKK